MIKKRKKGRRKKTEQGNPNVPDESRLADVAENKKPAEESDAVAPGADLLAAPAPEPGDRILQTIYDSASDRIRRITVTFELV